MQRKFLYTSVIALIAGAVGYSQLSGLMGWNAPADSTTDAGTLGRQRGGDNFNIGMPPTRDGPKVPDNNITLDNGIKQTPTVDVDDTN